MNLASKRSWLAALLAVCVAPTACTEEEKAPAQEVLRAVKYIDVAPSVQAPGQSFGGVTRAGSVSRLSFQVSGRIRQVYVKVGDRVKAGQRIATIDPTDIQLQLQQARASASQAKAQSVSADAAYNRVRALYENNNASRQDLDTARAQRDSAASSVSAATQSVRQLQRQISYATLNAPAEGTIATVQAESNEVASPGQVIATLLVGSQLEVAVDVPETFISSVHNGDRAKVRLGAINTTVTGTVHEIGVPVQGSTVFPITVLLPKAENLRPGLAATVMFELAQTKMPKGVVTVPAASVSEDRDGRFVYRLVDIADGKGRVRKTPVTVGNLQGSEILITKGIKPNDKIVTAGVNRIRDDLQVLVPGARKAPPNADKPTATPTPAEPKAAPKPDPQAEKAPKQ